MEQITRYNGKLYYGKLVCANSDDAYRRFRDDYHAETGKRFYYRLDARERRERIHGFHVYFSTAMQSALDREFGKPVEKIPYRLLGLVGISYCRGLSGADLPDLDDATYERWFYWFLSHAEEMMRRIGRNDKSGRTNKNRKRYR